MRPQSAQQVLDAAAAWDRQQQQAAFDRLIALAGADQRDGEGARLNEQERQDAVDWILVMARGGDPAGDQTLGIARPPERPGPANPT